MMRLQFSIPAEDNIRAKVIIFDYIVMRLLSWYKELSKEPILNDFSKLKCIKLHFFVCAASTTENDLGLLDTFDNFWALPYGHVESDVYNQIAFTKSINAEKLDTATINSYIEESSLLIDSKIKKEIDKTILSIRLKNNNFVLYSAIDLVELSHSWHSWKATFSLAKKLNKRGLPIPSEMIQSEAKTFKIDTLSLL